MTEALINYHQRAQALEQSARRLLNKPEGEALSPAEMDLLMATDAFMLAREDLAAELTPAPVAEAEPEARVAFTVEPSAVLHMPQPRLAGADAEQPGFEITP